MASVTMTRSAPWRRSTSPVGCAPPTKDRRHALRDHVGRVGALGESTSSPGPSQPVSTSRSTRCPSSPSMSLADDEQAIGRAHAHREVGRARSASSLGVERRRASGRAGRGSRKSASNDVAEPADVSPVVAVGRGDVLERARRPARAGRAAGSAAGRSCWRAGRAASGPSCSARAASRGRPGLDDRGDRVDQHARCRRSA